ncbi:sulfur carrier protein ThiS [Parageobacillus thermoglucosidasius]|uniref:sulfur carrier protein ThiS n=1 Tax=Parageobacillus thermoglucosidasius TaxID=1426 RepID=UPI000B57059D|nr:sulfur carrier protein ThiS [Parageobacillus thermoglucosidasius]MBY6268498.1 thiamine biosynthesis protein ThiS [Parageobacillus thermoglucosidasius]OUM89377.1 MAG: thiamine biosynthesis protein ThiS [Parageobacillus thermoglucosidasius]GMN99605.1 sulfur carrier protein ThiS [Parageobacillus thermoglucosidasius]
MRLIINGESIQVPNEVKTVSDLLAHFQLNKKIAVVEVNLTIIPKQQYETTVLCNGDKVEIVHFVGGG